MRIINRFLWFFHALLAILLALVMTTAWLGILPERLWLNEWHYAMTRPEVLGAIGLYFLLGLHLLGCALSSAPQVKPAKEIILSQGSPGEVKVAIPALTSLTERVALSVNAVREAKAVIETVKSDLPPKVKLSLTVLTEANLESVTTEVRAALASQFKRTLSLTDVPLDIAVTGISNAPVEKRRVI